MSEALELPITGRIIVAEGTLEVSLGLEGKHFDFVAGQYMRITFPHPLYDDGAGNWHEFSIASSPNETRYLKLACRISESAFKKNLQESSLGTIVLVQGPFGAFTLPKGREETIICIAGGIGVTPFLSMATFASEKKLRQEIILLYVNSSPESAAYVGELHALEVKNPNFTVKEKIGLLDDAFISENATKCLAGSSCVWYMAGPPRMVRMAMETLLRKGIDEKKIFTEEFSNYAD